jgi:GT2 family glycosyltransferase
MDSIALIVPTLNRYDLFVNMIQSIDYPVKPYVINNGRSGNIGVAAAWNKGIKNALEDGYEYAIITNDDVEFLSGTIGQLVIDIRNYDSLIISTNSILPARDGKEFHYKSEGMTVGSDYACFMVKIKTLFEEVGEFDENFYPAYYEDNDMQYRIKLAGHKEYMNTDIGIIHHGSSTQFSLPGGVVSEPNWTENKEYYKRKWGGYPLEEQWTHPYNEEGKDIKYWREPKNYMRESDIGLPQF